MSPNTVPTSARRAAVVVVVAGVVAALFATAPAAHADVECADSDPVEVVPFDDVAPESPFCSAIAALVADGVVQGLDDDTFAGTLPVSRAGVAVLLHRAAGSPQGPFVDPGFTDVPRTAVFATEISWLAAVGGTSGNADGTFGPTDPMSRGEFTALLFRLAGSPTGPFASPGFGDVAPDGLFADAIAWAADGSIVTGRADGTFAPEDGVTRAAAVGVLAPFVAVVDLAALPILAPTLPDPRPEPTPTTTPGPA